MWPSRASVAAAAFLLVALVAGAGCALSGRATRSDEIEREVRAVLARQQSAWNAGDLDGFLAPYLDDPRLRFVTALRTIRGLDAVRERYHARYQDPRSMGRLRFDDLEVQVLAPDVALCTGAWELERGAERPHGRFSLVLVRGPGGFGIVHDHTSSAPPPDS